MPEPASALLPSPALFDVTTVAQAPEGTLVRVPLDGSNSPRTRAA